MKVLSSKPVSLAEVNDVLKKRAKDSELGYEQETTQEYCERFCKHTKAESNKLLKEVMKNDKIPEETAIKIVDLAPKSADLVISILLKDKVELSEEELNAVVKIFTK